MSNKSKASKLQKLDRKFKKISFSPPASRFWIQQTRGSPDLHQTLHLSLHRRPRTWCFGFPVLGCLDSRLWECSNRFGFDERRSPDGQLRGGLVEHRHAAAFRSCDSVSSQWRNMTINLVCFSINNAVPSFLRSFMLVTRIIMLCLSLEFCVAHESAYWFGKIDLRSYQSFQAFF